MTPLSILLGALTGAGIYLIISALIPTQPSLSAALERLTTNQATLTLEPPPQGLEEKIGIFTEKIATQIPGIITPRKDLALINWSVRKFYGQKGMAALIGILFPIVVTTFSFIFGFTLPIPITIASSLLLAIIFFFIPDFEVRQRAAKARTHYSKVVAAYVDFIALSRLGGAATTQAMKDAAHVGENELFLKIRQTLELSRLRGTSAWNELRDLGNELGIKELGEVADIMRLSGEEGAGIWKNLRSHARSMRNAQLRNKQGEANIASESMTLPLVVLASAFIGLLITPSFLTILGS